MLDKSLHVKLSDTLKACDLHHERMITAHRHLNPLLPLDENKYSQLSEEMISFSDQLIYRFAKLQDMMGNKLFRLVLQGLGEDIHDIPFIDLITKLERLHLIEDHNQWLLLRETRNLVAHEYPFNKQEVIEGLNEISQQSIYLSGIYSQLKNFISTRFQV